MTFQLVQPAGISASQGDVSSHQAFVQDNRKSDYEVLSNVRPSLQSHSDSDSSKLRTSKFRPSRQIGQGRSPGY